MVVNTGKIRLKAEDIGAILYRRELLEGENFMEVKKERLFSNRKLILLIIPLIIEQALNSFVGMVDGMMISSAGEAAISGVSLVDMINGIMLTLFAALATGGTVVTSQYLGAKNMEKARRSAGQLLLMAAVLGVVLMAVCLVFPGQLVDLFFGSIEADVREACLIYLRITALSFPFIALFNAGAAIFRSTGNSQVSMRVSLLMNVINVVGNAICVLGLKMGVAGVAIPTLISRAVAAAILLVRVSRRDNALCVDLKNLFHVETGMMKNILGIGIPSACENAFFSLGRTVVVSFISVYGTVQITANSVANALDNLAIILGLAMGMAMVTVVGQCVGAGDKEQTRYYIKKLLKWSYVMMGAVNVLMMIFCPQLIGLYSNLSGETVALAYKLVMMHSFFAIPMWPLSFILPNALRAASDAKFTMWVGIFSMLSMRIGLGWYMCIHLGWGAVGIWIGMILDWVVRIACFVPRMLSGKWLTKYQAA